MSVVTPEKPKRTIVFGRKKKEKDQEKPKESEIVVSSDDDLDEFGDPKEETKETNQPSEPNESFEATNDDLPESFTFVSPKEKAKAIIQAHNLPPHPKGRVEFDVMIDWLNLLTDDQWSQIKVYCYRLEPLVTTTPAYAAIFDDRFTRDDVTTKLGGGKFDFIINHYISNGAKPSNTLFKARLNIQWNEIFPRIDWSTLRWEDNNNRPFINYAKQEKRIPKEVLIKYLNEEPIGDSSLNLDKVIDLVEKKNQQVVNVIKESYQNKTSSAESQGFSTVLSMVAEAQKTTMSTVMDVLKQTNPKDSVKESMELMKLVMDTKEAANDKTTKFFELMLQQKQEEVKAIREELKELKETLNAKPEKEEKTLAEQIKETKDLADALGLSKKGSGGALETIMSTIAPALPQLVQLGTLLLTRSLQNAGVPNPQQQTPPSNITSNGGMLSGAALAPTEQQTQQPGLENILMPTIDPLTQELIQATQSFGGLIIQSMQTNTGGHLFMEELIQKFGQLSIMAHSKIAALGKDRILEIWKGIPEFWNHISYLGDENIGKWIEQFLDYENLLKETGEEEDED